MDSELGIIVGAIAATVTAIGAGLGRLVRWAFTQWRAERAADREVHQNERTVARTERREERAEDRAVLRENTSAVNELATHLKSMREDWEEITGVHDRPKKKRIRTAPMGVTAYGVRKDED